VRVKICGVTRPEDARDAVRAGADLVGAILSPGFPRAVPPEHAGGYLKSRGETTLAGVFVDPSLAQVVAGARTSGAGVVQLHGEEPPELLRALRDEGPWELWKAVRVESADDVRSAVEAYGPVVDGLVFDGAPSGRRGGGHGERFPWHELEAARDVLGASDLIVAGGLDPHNVAEAVRRLAPDVVDVSSGVEVARGVKDRERMEAFVRNARAARGSL
jgi:phosphoribosylanthranilate isomerase